MSAAFQAMPDRCRTRYFVQVDADMVLEPDAVERLYERIRRSGLRTYQVSGQLYEEGFGPGGAVKCWKRAVFRLLRFRDVRTVDRDFYRRAGRLGLRRDIVGEIVGRHLPRYSPASEYLKTKGDVEKWRFLGRPAEQYALPLLDELLAGYPESRQRLLGALVGALTGPERLARSKDVRHEREVLAGVLAFLHRDLALEPAPDLDADGLRARFAAAYADEPARARLAESVLGSFGADGQPPERLLALTAA